MGGLIAKLKQPLQRFNIENRTNAVLSRNKPIPAPKHAASIKQLKAAQESNPEFLKKHYEKNVQLDERLKNVYVTSMGPQTDTLNQSNPDRPLPVSRTSESLESSFYTPDSVPIGKITLREIFQLLILNKEDSVKNTPDILAKKYNLDKEIVDKLLENYKLYQLILPKKFSDQEMIEKYTLQDNEELKQKLLQFEELNEKLRK